MIIEAVEQPRHTPFLLRGKRHMLTCVPVKDVAVCVLSDHSRSEREPWQILTPREVQVLRQLADGATTHEAASNLRLSGATVRTHVENMRTKLGAATRASLVALGFRLGFLD